LAALWLIVAATWAAPSSAGDSAYCLRSIPMAEHAFGIPAGLLHAISLVESGRDGGPWPWTLNIDGKGVYAATWPEAVRLMTTQDGALRQAMAVGCMQIYARYHGERFASAAQMIEPRVNVWYAAWYLHALYLQQGSWTRAVARYHAGSIAEQTAYLCSVTGKRIELRYQRPTRWYRSACAKGEPAAR
jgi:hypothetical protein